MTSTPQERSTSFGHLRIAYDQRVLEPRTWTEAQSRWAAELLRSVPPGPVLELCAGAGQIGLLAVALEARPLVCVDLSPVACAFATRNAAAAGLADLVEVREGAIEDSLAAEEWFALVIADPPWVPHDDIGRFPQDPTVAIDGGGDGLDVARECLAAAGAHVVPGGSVLVQLGTEAQAVALAGALAGALSGALSGETDLVAGEVRSYERGVVARFDRAPGPSPLDGDADLL